MSNTVTIYTFALPVRPLCVNLFHFVDYHCSLFITRLQGGELFDYLIEKEYLSEKDATCYVWELLEIINYLHQQQICHLDLKVGMQNEIA